MATWRPARGADRPAARPNHHQDPRLHSRIQSVDVLRAAATVCVIAIHTTPFERQASPLGQAVDLALVVNQLARFAVPLFFVLSGFFWAQKFGDAAGVMAPTQRMSRRVAFLFAGWSLVYLWPFYPVSSGVNGSVLQEIYWNLVRAVQRPLEGPRLHLWFLPALLCAMWVSATLLARGRVRLLAAVAVLLYAVGLAGMAYRDSPFGFHAQFIFRYGPFFGTLFFVTGYALQRRGPRVSWLPVGIALAVLGLIVQTAEVWWLHRAWGTTMAQDYVVGTYFYGLGMAMVALSDAPVLRMPRVAAAGVSGLGIYLTHLMFVDTLVPMERRWGGHAWWEIAYVLLVFASAYGFTILLGRWRVTRKLVE